MTSRTGSKVRKMSESAAWQLGVNFAICLLIETERALDEMALDSSCRDGRPQNNVVLRYFKRLRAFNDPRVETAFSAVLTEHIAGATSGCVLDTKHIRRQARRRIATTAEIPGA